MIIEDGGGSGKSAKISADGEVLTQSIAASTEHAANHRGDVYTALFAVDPAGPDDCIFYMKNTASSDLVIEGVWWQTSAAEEVYYKLGDVGTAVKTAGTDIVPGNLNAGSGKVASVTCHSNTDDGAVDITGLSGGTTVQKLWLTTTQTQLFNEEADIIVPKNQTFSIYCVGGDTLLRGSVVFYFASSASILE